VNGILAQRLVRVLCPVCKQRVDPDGAVREQLRLDAAAKFSRAPGCEFCRGAGIAGRTGIFELVAVTPNMRQLITSRGTEAALCEATRSVGSRSLFQDGLRKVLSHTVAYEELLRVAEPDEAQPA
jgi:type II secretory ATPase GspE/PulE/Tfp pilus assembly ATPase PilB-like protein